MANGLSPLLSGLELDAPPLISCEELRSLLAGSSPRVALFDCRYDLGNPDAGRAAWREECIQGARHLDLGDQLSGNVDRTSGRHPLPDPGLLAVSLESLGLKSDSIAVCYDSISGMFSARLWWTLCWLGHKGALVLDGGIDRWKKLGYECGPAGKARPSADGNFRPRPQPLMIAEAEQIMSGMEKGEHLCLDARSPDRFSGEHEPLDPIGGHIPGAVNRYYMDNLSADNLSADNLSAEGTFKPGAQLSREFLALLGARAPEDTVCYCGSGVSACHNLLAMQLAGLKGARLYPGSWSQWCRLYPSARG